MTGPVGLTALMGAPMIDLEKLFSGRESNSALEAVQMILFNGDKVKEKIVTDGIRITEDVQLLEKAQVLLLIIVSGAPNGNFRENICSEDDVEASNVINDPKCNKGLKCNNFWP